MNCKDGIELRAENLKELLTDYILKRAKSRVQYGIV